MSMTIFLEFERLESGRLAALGSDVIFYRDGRWSERTFRDKCRERAAEVIAYKGGPEVLRFVGYTIAGQNNSQPRLHRID